MRQEVGIHHGDLLVGDEVIFHGFVTGSVTVAEGATFTLSGLIGGDLRVLANATTMIHGSVRGSVHNVGGTMRLRGTIGGNVDGDAAQTQISSRRLIGGRWRSQQGTEEPGQEANNATT